jgi:nucleotide-binding universal stress UspA family protein
MDAQGAMAFAHALKLAVARKGGLTMLHAGRARASDPHEDFIRVQETLVRWNLLAKESATDAIPNLGLDVQKVVALDSDAARSAVRYLARHPHDLIVLATHQQEGLHRWISPEIAQSLARSSGGMTLFLPQQTKGIVSHETGAVSLSSILVPVDTLPDPRSAVDAALAVPQALGCSDIEVTLLYVGGREHAPYVRNPESASAKWRWAYREGEVDSEILRAAREYHADLIVMATEGRHGFLDALRGSTTERIVRNADCPVLAVPAYRTHDRPSPSTMAADLSTGKLTV